MKSYHLICILGITLCLSACGIASPTYFGSKYPPTETVETFYAAKDIKRPYKVIGHMVSPITDSEAVQEKVKLNLTNRAKSVGADGLIFSDISRQAHAKTTDDFSIKAEAIVFTDK